VHGRGDELRAAGIGAAEQSARKIGALEGGVVQVPVSLPNISRAKNNSVCLRSAKETFSSMYNPST
jgi:hypothetical protein